MAKGKLVRKNARVVIAKPKAVTMVKHVSALSDEKVNSNLDAMAAGGLCSPYSKEMARLTEEQRKIVEGNEFIKGLMEFERAASRYENLFELEIPQSKEKAADTYDRIVIQVKSVVAAGKKLKAYWGRQNKSKKSTKVAEKNHVPTLMEFQVALGNLRTELSNEINEVIGLVRMERELKEVETILTAEMESDKLKNHFEKIAENPDSSESPKSPESDFVKEASGFFKYLESRGNVVIQQDISEKDIDFPIPKKPILRKGIKAKKGVPCKKSSKRS